MDRLQEANKVATLMRRRENLKPVVPTQAESLSSLQRRGFNQNMRVFEPAPAADQMRSLQPALDAEVRAGGSFFAPRAVGPIAKQKPRAVGYLPTAGDATEPVLPPLRGHAMRVSLPGQRQARLGDLARTLKARRRGFPLPRRRTTRAMLPGDAVRKPHGGATFHREANPPRELDLPVHAGRVARSVGKQAMRPPNRHLRKLVVARRKAELVWPASIMPDLFVKEGPEPRARTPVIVPLLRAVSLPRGPGHGVLPRLGRGAARRVSRTVRDFRMQQRAAAIDWSGANLPPLVLDDGHVVDADIESAAWQRGDTRSVTLAPKTYDVPPRFSTVSFEPQEAPFGYSIFKIQSGMPALPVSQAPAPKASPQQRAAKQTKKPKAESICLEDRFDAGLGNWVGGVSEWKIDVAGVRPGGLALFAPSLGLVDYDLEFLARIDQKSLSWVFRAADEQNYHLATLSVSPQGRTFTRSSVIEDSPGLSVTTPVRQSGGAKAAVTILTKVRGNDFTVSIDGEVIERWSDNRLAIGGVGFMGGPEQRARLYWIRLTSDASGQ